jgi:hypothetical protein
VLFYFSLVLVLIPHAFASNGTLVVNPSNIDEGAVLVGTTRQQSATLTNPGGPKVTITKVTLTGTGFSVQGLYYPLTLAGGQSVQCGITFAPQTAGSFSASLSISYSSGGGGRGNSGYLTPLTVPLSGTGFVQGQLGANPGSFNFGNVQVGNNQTQWETVSNSGAQTVNISQASASGPGFSISGLTPPLSLDPGQSVTFSASFSPQSPGNVSGSIAISSDAYNANLTIPLAGNGTAPGQLGVTPNSYDFGSVMVGSKASTQGSLNASSANVTVNSVNLSNSEFAVSGISFPLTIPAGQSAAFTVTFAPQSSGIAAGTAAFVSDAGNSPTALSLSGNGTAPQPHSVDLSWTASQSPNIIGYNVYRSPTSGGPYTQINSGLGANTAYTDNSVTPGSTYYYVTTAVDSSNQESAYSNQSMAQIPTP